MVEKIARVNTEMSSQEREKLEAKRLKEACCDFEAILLSQVFQSMRANPLAEESKDPAREMYEGMMDQTLASDISRGNSTGLAELLYRQLSSEIKSQ